MEEIIREIRINDVENFNQLLDSVINQSEYLLFNPGEHQISIQNQTLFLEEMITTSNSTIIVAELNDVLIGYVTIQGGRTHRNQHSAKLAMGLLPTFRNKGIGYKLLQKSESWAIERQLHRLELTVVTENEPAYRLYEKFGFKIEGRKEDTLYFNEKYYDEFVMAKLL